MADAISSTTSSSNVQTGTKSATEKLDEDFTQFLTLLTTQLQNQDPLSPMDSTEFTNQLVNFTGVEQQINSNKKLDSMIGMLAASSFSAAMNYVGKEVSYVSSEANFDGTNPVTINYAVGDGTAVTKKINIYDSEGKIVFTKDISSEADTSKFSWDGKNSEGTTLAKGTYSIRVDALDAEGKGLDTTTVVNGTVKGVETQSGLTMLLVGDRAVSLSNVINVVDPKLKDLAA